MDITAFKERFDLGFDNPNKTAALMAMLAVSSWLISGIRRWGFWISLILCSIFGYFLILTHSRGGLVSASAGLLILAAFAPRRWKNSRLIALSLSLIAFIAYAAWEGAAHRYVQAFIKEDLSISNRLAIWKHVPQMIADAPRGWGIGNSGEAFMQWYQDIGRHESYRTLVNSHLTWLVELGWPFRLLYVFAWSATLAICWPRKGDCSLIVIGFATWIALFLSSWFSSVAEAAVLWIIPLAWLLAVISIRVHDKSWPKATSWRWPALTSCLLPLVIFGVFALTGCRHVVRFDGVQTILGNGQPDIYVVSPDIFIMGDRYGQELRKAALKTVIAITPTDRMIDPTKPVVYVGRYAPNPSILQKTASLILLNPSWNPESMDQKYFDTAHIKILCGEFDGKVRRSEWASLSGLHPNIELLVLDGFGEYVPTWIDLVFSPLKQP